MQINPADLPTLTNLIADLQAAQLAHDTRASENARLSKALSTAKPDTPEHAEAKAAWEDARKNRPAGGASVLEARDKLADFAQRIKLVDGEAEVARNPIPGAEGDGAGISREPL